MRRKLFLMFVSLYSFFLFLVPYGNAVMLSSERIAYVDIERIFEEYKGTQQAKKKMQLEIETRRKEIDRLEKEIKDLEATRKKGEVWEAEPITGLVGGEGVEFSTVTVVRQPIPEETVESKKKNLSGKVEDMKEELTRIEEEVTHQILGKIYDVIREIAREEGYAIVLDKKNVLYSQIENDLTEKVIKKLNLGE